VCLYAPFSWLLWINYPWSTYRTGWLRLSPILPGFVPGVLSSYLHRVLMFPTMGLAALVLLVGLTWLGARGRIPLAVAAIVALMVSIPSAWVAYRAFLAW
jgi:hypothetical protein